MSKHDTAGKGRLQPDADYLKSEGIGLVIAKGMAVMY